MIGKSGERGSGISVLAVRHDDNSRKKLINMNKSKVLKYLKEMQIKPTINTIIFVVNSTMLDNGSLPKVKTTGNGTSTC